MLGRAMTDIENLHGTCQITVLKENAILEERSCCQYEKLS